MRADDFDVLIKWKASHNRKRTEEHATVATFESASRSCVSTRVPVILISLLDVHKIYCAWSTISL